MLIKEQIAHIREEIGMLQADISRKWREIAELETTCQHNWSLPRFAPLKIDCFEGSYGTILQQRKWERECSNCGKIETTYKEKQVSYPDFGD